MRPSEVFVADGLFLALCCSILKFLRGTSSCPLCHGGLLLHDVVDPLSIYCFCFFKCMTSVGFRMFTFAVLYSTNIFKICYHNIFSFVKSTL